jgi:hypothetical protein
MNMATSEDVETQQKGLVGIFYQMNPSTRVMFETEERAMIRRIINCIPLRYSGCHMCLPDSPVFSFVKAVGLAAAGPAIRKRFRFHFGTCFRGCSIFLGRHQPSSHINECQRG